jgi:hypothetical protein
LTFPPRQAANILRGWFGLTLARELPDAYRQIFAPRASLGAPSGLADPARPFVLRASHLDGCTFECGASFWLGIHLFDRRSHVMEIFERAFGLLASAGLGARSARADLVGIERVDATGRPTSSEIAIPLFEPVREARELRVDFRTPTDLKNEGVSAARPDFSVLFARARDRVGVLSALYGDGTLPIDHRALGDRAQAVKMTVCDVRRVAASRRSSRTGQTHSIGGFVGTAEYAGDLGEFLPYLTAARFAGVGRHTVWGNGEIVPEGLAGPKEGTPVGL